MTDFLIILAVLTVLAAFAFTIFAREQKERERAMQAQCAHNLKGIGNQFHFWADFKDGYFPMSLSQVIGGSEEFSTGTNAWRHFQVLSNFGFTPRTLICPADEVSSRWPNVRVPARDFTVFGNANLSYFAGLDAKKSKRSSILSGDRNITNGVALKDGVMELTTNTPAGWTGEIHEQGGNVLFADGSVRQMNGDDLRDAVAKSGFATNRIQMPILTP